MPALAGSARTTIGLFLRGLGFGGGDVTRRPPCARACSCAAAARVHVHVRALPHVALEDAGDQRRLLERQILGGLAEVEPRGRLDAVDAVAEVHLVAVEREDLALGVALLDLDREERFLDLPLPGLLVGQEQLARSCWVSVLAPAALRRSTMSLTSVTTMRGMLRPKCCSNSESSAARIACSQLRRDRFVRNDLAALDGELADDLAARAVDARDRARRVVVERGDLRQVAGVGEDHAGGDAEDRGDDEERDDAGAAGDSHDVPGHNTDYSVTPLSNFQLPPLSRPGTGWDRESHRLALPP